MSSPDARTDYAATNPDEPYYELTVDLETHRQLRKIAEIKGCTVEEALEMAVDDFDSHYEIGFGAR